MVGRTPYEYKHAHKDNVNQPIVDLLCALQKYWDCYVIFVTARECKPLPHIRDITKEDKDYYLRWSIHTAWENKSITYSTHEGDGVDFVLKDTMDIATAWINSHVPIDPANWNIFSRKQGDNKKDRYAKYDIYKEHIKPYYNVKMVIDDRSQVVEMWRHGAQLPCIQVADGNF